MHATHPSGPPTGTCGTVRLSSRPFPFPPEARIAGGRPRLRAAGARRERAIQAHGGDLEDRRLPAGKLGPLGVAGG